MNWVIQGLHPFHSVEDPNNREFTRFGDIGVDTFMVLMYRVTQVVEKKIKYQITAVLCTCL